MINIQVIGLSNPLWSQSLQKLRHDIYHLPDYVDLEARRTKTIPEAILIIDGKKLFFVPYLLRQCNNVFNQDLTTQEALDVVSPYGYPGILLSEAAKTPEFIDFAMKELMRMLRAKQVCSIFFRLHPIINQGFDEIFQPGILEINGETISIDLRLVEAKIWHQTSSEHRTKINKCKRVGFTARMVPFKKYINDFNVIYEETMSRVGAANLYYFVYDYFLHLSDVLGEHLHLCIVELNEQITCVGLI